MQSIHRWGLGGILRALGGALLVTLSAGAAKAEVPACTAGTAGQLSVQGNVQCACRFYRASPAAGTAAGHRWDCGILRARTNHEVPATANPYPYPLPGALSLDRTLVLQGRGPAKPGRPGLSRQ
jgi:hypothetical protein